MARTRSALILAAAALLGAGAVAVAPIPARPALAGDGKDTKDAKKAEAEAKDAEKLKKKRDEFRDKLKKAGKLPFLDLSYAADPKACADERWSQNENPQAKEDSGLQFNAVWSVDSTKGMGIDIRVIKLVHKPTPTTKGVYPFEKLGKQVDCADAPGILDGIYEETRKSFTNIVEDKCTKPKNKKVGPTSMFASVFGTDSASQKRARKDFYVWMDGGVTWLVLVDFNDKYIDEPDILEKAEKFIATWKDPKAPTK